MIVIRNQWIGSSKQFLIKVSESEEHRPETCKKFARRIVVPSTNFLA